MKQYAIGLITGILLTASAVMFMGATNGENEFGKYQSIYCGKSNDVYKVPIVRMINTETGDLYEYGAIRHVWKLKGGFKK